MYPSCPTFNAFFMHFKCIKNNNKRLQQFISEPVYQEIKHDIVVLSTNGIRNGENTQEHNGIGLATNLCKQYYTMWNCFVIMH